MTTVKIGNLFESETQTLVNTVNCVGVMGKGIAAEFKKRYPNMFRDYKARCDAGLVRLGRPYLYSDLMGVCIINFPTKDHWRSPSRLQDIADGLDYFVAHYSEWGITSIAVPPLGCGNGGLEWSAVGPLIYQKLNPLPIVLEMYAPYGTSTTQLSDNYLSSVSGSQAAVGIHHEKLRDSWLAILEVVYQLAQQPYANPVGRTIFQKISYIMTELGVETGFTFQKGSYGPFSPELQSALTVVANANLVREKQLGKMTAIVPSGEYARQRPDMQPRLAPYQKWIDKTVDLFSRIKNTVQAEEVTTIIYAAKRLKRERDAVVVSEQDVFDFIMNWKKSWQNETKQESVVSGIRHLQMLGWVKLQYSESLPYDVV